MAITSVSDFGAGLEGTVTRSNVKIEPALWKDATTAVEPGRAVYFNASGKLDYVTDPDTNAIIGITTRSYPSYSDMPEGNLYGKDRPIGVLKEGCILVKCTKGTPVRGGKVYIFKEQGTGSEPVGTFAAEADTTKTVECTNLRWACGGVDNGIAEVEIFQ